ncbi:MAG: hypothetical protein P4N41_18190 [Negativicutes bacterium]|nr:hypothetical protein [Negativicutes bacterium]
MPPQEKQPPMIAISVETLNDLFGLIRGVTDEINKVDKKVTSLLAIAPEKEKRCDDHNKKTDDHENRIRTVELWKAGQQGVAGFIQRWGPVIVAASVALYVGWRH